MRVNLFELAVLPYLGTGETDGDAQVRLKLRAQPLSAWIRRRGLITRLHKKEIGHEICQSSSTISTEVAQLRNL